MTQKLDTSIIGVAGVYYVAAELSRRGYIALATTRNTKGIEIRALTPYTRTSVGIQVKTSQTGRKQWVLSSSAEHDTAPTMCYVFVCLRSETERASFHIIASERLARIIKQQHADWPGRRGRRGPHKDNPVRVFSDENDTYRDKWDALGLKTCASGTAP